ncbi:unnamed protein product [Symbiodinium pilosum]|uniref:Uncharacterized protein n=1 Tax=Symbiodinium pilosum TaxID=2952 RepID=A0A812ISW3_SYMPI|nr:unnamed protein product [Symbiodinium pilosum]
MCLELDLLQDGRLDACDWCGESQWRIEAKRDHASYRCKTKNCRCSKSALSNDHDLFNKKCALRSMIGVLWLFLCPINVSPDQAGLILGLGHRTVRDVFSNFRAWLTPIVDRLNEELVVGSAGADIELDELSFRSKPLEDKVLWIRYIGIPRCFCSSCREGSQLLDKVEGVFAEMRKTERASLGSVSWETFKQFAKQPAAQEVLQQPADLVEGPELEAEPVAAVADVEPLLDDLDQASVQSELFDPDDEDADLEVVGVRQLN